MNEKASNRRQNKSLWLRWPLWVVVVPLTAIFVLTGAYAGYELRAASRVQAEIGHLRAEGRPVDDESSSRRFFDSTHREGAATWGEILRIVNHLPIAPEFENLRYVGVATLPATITPEEPWQEERHAAEFLQWMRPAIDRIEAAAEYPTPVWLPLHFDGYHTVLEDLQNSRSIMRVLSLEVEHAVYHRDAQRALRGLRLMDLTARAFAWDVAMVAELIQIAFRQVHQQMIRRSLSAEVWTEEQLKELDVMVGTARDLPRRWQRVMVMERALMLASIDDPRYWGDEPAVDNLIRRIPSLRELLLQDYRRMEDAADRGWPELRRQMADFEGAIGVRGLVGLTGSLVPAVNSFATALEREEDSRRLTRASLAVKRYHLLHDRMPERLSELRQFGLTPDDWNTLSGGPLGYEVEGREAYLWSYLPGKETRVPAERPPVEELETQARGFTIIR